MSEEGEKAIGKRARARARVHPLLHNAITSLTAKIYEHSKMMIKGTTVYSRLQITFCRKASM